MASEILKGAPNPSVAEAFVRFVMSPAGQKLWLWVKGAADGPRNFQLNRFSVLPSLYGLSPEHTAVKLNPFSWRSDFPFDESLASARYAIVNDLVGTMVIDPKKLLTRAWRTALAAGFDGGRMAKTRSYAPLRDRGFATRHEQMDRSCVSQSKAKRMEPVRPREIPEKH